MSLTPPPPPDQEDSDEQTLPTLQLTWAALLGRWVDFARSALALPDTPDGRAMRRLVPDIIMLQAIYFALQELSGLPRDEQRLGVDRAAVLLERHRGAIEAGWPEDRIPATLRELIHDVERALCQFGEDGGRSNDMS